GSAAPLVLHPPDPCDVFALEPVEVDVLGVVDEAVVVAEGGAGALRLEAIAVRIPVVSRVTSRREHETAACGSAARPCPAAGQKNERCLRPWRTGDALRRRV